MPLMLNKQINCEACVRTDENSTVQNSKVRQKENFSMVDILISYERRICRKVLISMRGNPYSVHNEAFIGDKRLQSVKKQVCSS